MSPSLKAHVRTFGQNESIPKPLGAIGQEGKPRPFLHSKGTISVAAA